QPAWFREVDDDGRRYPVRGQELPGLAGRGPRAGREDLGGAGGQAQGAARQARRRRQEGAAAGVLGGGGSRPHSTRPRAATLHPPPTRSPRTASTRSCRFETTQAWLGSTRTRSPTRKRSPSSTASTPCSSLSRSTRARRPSTQPKPSARGRRGSLDSVLLPASST